MNTEVLVYVFLCYLIAGFIKGLSGLGFSAVAIGIMATFLPMPLAIPLVVIPSMVTCLQVMRDAGHFRETVQQFATLYWFTLPGLFAGLWLLANSEAYLAKSVLGIVLGLYGVW
ncbi:MAG: TSUP family transporter, partial [Gammaproteobacteria bacterium]